MGSTSCRYFRDNELFFEMDRSELFFSSSWFRFLHQRFSQPFNIFETKESPISSVQILWKSYKSPMSFVITEVPNSRFFCPLPYCYSRLSNFMVTGPAVCFRAEDHAYLSARPIQSENFTVTESLCKPKKHFMWRRLWKAFSELVYATPCWLVFYNSRLLIFPWVSKLKKMVIGNGHTNSTATDRWAATFFYRSCSSKEISRLPAQNWS